VEADLPGIGRRILLFNARRLPPIEGDVPMLLLSIGDVTAGLPSTGKKGLSR
jgi:hypothetical protein